MTRPRCSHPLCPFPPTRATYSAQWTDADPWAPEGFHLWCGGHAPATSWPVDG